MDVSDMDSCLWDDSCPTPIRREDESQTGRADPKQFRLSQAEFSPCACSNVPAVPLYRIYHANSEIGYQPVTKQGRNEQTHNQPKPKVQPNRHIPQHKLPKSLSGAHISR